MSLQYRLLSFYLITTLGYSITGLATFLSIERTFDSIDYLGIALSLRTLSSCILGYKANHLIQKINIRNSFLLALILGFLSIVSIFLGFTCNSFLTILFAVILIGLPATLTNILLSILFKLVSDKNEIYRKYSGYRELIFGLARFLACILAPLILLQFNLNVIIFFNLITYLIGAVILSSISFKEISGEKIEKPSIDIYQIILKSKDTWSYICQIASSSFLIALIPLLASSNKIAFTKDLPLLVRQSLWSLEAITMILGSIVYLFAKKLRSNEILKTILMLNSVFLFLFLFTDQAILTIGVIMLMSILMMISFYIFRDDYIINAGKDVRLIQAYSSFSSVMKDLICSISPIVLTYLLTSSNLNRAITFILFIQISFYLIYLLFTKRSKIIFADAN